MKNKKSKKGVGRRKSTWREQEFLELLDGAVQDFLVHSGEMGWEEEDEDECDLCREMGLQSAGVRRGMLH